MMKNRILLCMVFILSNMMLCRAQNVFDYSDGNSTIPEPQLWSFMKYGGSQPNLYTGTATATIPIYTYQDNDFTFPISLSYATNGYMPNVQANDVGLGWFLNVGGSITREVQGIPDECLTGAPYGSLTKLLHGFNRYCLYRKENPTAQPLEEIARIRGGYLNNSSYYSRGFDLYDTEPDIFHFNFMGYDGYFMISLNGVDVISSSHPDGEYKIDLFDFEKQFGTTWFTITTGDGYTYTFGGDQKAYDGFSYYKNMNEYNPQYLPQRSLHQYKNSWKLTRITAPNGRSIHIEYSDVQQTENMRPGGYVGTVSTAGSLSSDLLDPYWAAHRFKSENLLYQMVYKNNTTQIKKIRIDDKMEIDFIYGDNTRKAERRVETIDINKDDGLMTVPCLQEIKAISMFENRKVIKSCLLNYTYPTSKDARNNPVLFLSSLYLSGQGSFTMEYNDLDKIFPLHGTTSVDHWGYNNAAPDYKLDKFLPIIFVDTMNYAATTHPIYDSRKADFNYARYGTLKKMTYPTGGYTCYEYENHQYSRYVTRDSRHNGLPYMCDLQDSAKAGGVRIRKIIDHYNIENGVSPSRSHSREYIYSGDNKSTGTLLKFPRYFKSNHSTISTASSKWTNYYDMISTTDLSSYSLDKSHIEYSMVTEKFEDGSSVVYKFSDYIQYPDIYKITYRGYLDKNYICSYPAEANSLLAAPNNIVSQRGRLLETHYYNTQGQMVRQDKTTYQRLDSLENPKYIVYAKPAVTNLFEQKIIADSGPVKSVTTIDILPSISLIKTSKAFIYNALGQKAGIYQTNSDGSTVCDSTAYVSDIPLMEQSRVHKMMLLYNQLNAPIASIRKVKKAGSATETVVRSDTYEYMRHPSVATLNPLKNIQSVQPGLNYENKTQSHNIVTYNLHDTLGRVLQVTDKNNVPTCYVWGYKGLYPVAKIVNAKYEYVMRCVSQTSEYNPLAGALSQSMVDQLRSLNGAEVTVYDYEPFVGVTRVEDPSGRVTSYFYNKSGKLSSIKDDKGYIVKEFQYSIN